MYKRQINGGMILGEIGDIHRFSNPNKLLAFAGLDPSVYQSGNFQAKTTRDVYKRQNKELAQAGPFLLSLFTVYGDVAAGPPQIEEHPVALEMYICCLLYTSNPVDSPSSG